MKPKNKTKKKTPQREEVLPLARVVCDPDRYPDEGRIAEMNKTPSFRYYDLENLLTYCFSDYPAYLTEEEKLKEIQRSIEENGRRENRLARGPITKGALTVELERAYLPVLVGRLRDESPANEKNRRAKSPRKPAKK